MTRRAWLVKALAVLAVATPVVVGDAEPAQADHRHRSWYDDGWYGGPRHWHHRHHWHGRHWRHRHHDGFSATFLFDLTPRPPRRVYAAPPPPVIVRRPPTVVYQAPPPAYCREYTTTVMVNGRPVETYGTACLQPDGRWRIVSMN